MDFDEALSAFDVTEANVIRLEKVRTEMNALVPPGIAFIEGSSEGRRYQELLWAYDELVAALPAISGFQITASPLSLNAIAEWRLDGNEIGELSAQLDADEAVSRPDAEIARYRHVLDGARRTLVRERVAQLLPECTGLIDGLAARAPGPAELVTEEDWDQLQEKVRQLDRLVGPQMARSKAWMDMHRHLRFGQGQDLRDIVMVDWPALRKQILSSVYTELEPIPVSVTDLGLVAAAPPSGPVATKLNWAQLTDEQFERLLFGVISDTATYENAQWLTRTNAPDKGRDLSADRVKSDPLSGSVRERVIIQARHRLNDSINLQDVTLLVAQMRLWEPPPVHVLIVATSGRFTTDAIDWIERHNEEGRRPRVEMWPESHLERLLAERPHVAAAFPLR